MWMGASAFTRTLPSPQPPETQCLTNRGQDGGRGVAGSGEEGVWGLGKGGGGGGATPLFVKDVEQRKR